jgi:ribonuclease E
VTETTRPDGGNAQAPDDQRVRTRTRTRTRRPRDEAAEPTDIADAAATGVPDADAAAVPAPDAAVVDTDPEAAADVAREDATEEQDDSRPTRSRRSRRRGGRGRGRRGSGRNRQAAAGEESAAPAAAPDAAPVDAAPVDAAPGDLAPGDLAPGDAGPGDAESVAAPSAADSSSPSTRLAGRSRSARGRSATRSTRGRSTGGARTTRRPLGGVSEETRRAITEGPPRRMMVTVGEKRTQIAVLEERTLVEHYVTRREDVSYVGNIYLGRVQNVLPGMEAAFIDIGKGRNGVLYAGEVNYDEADLEGDLPRIEQTLKPGQSVLVQVTKDPMGTKGARLTQHLSIAGRYCVLAPGEDMLGISRKLTDDERERLRKILKGLKPEGYGLIVRTAAEGATREQLEADVARLQRIWDQVRARAEQAEPLEAVYEEPGLVIRVIRDVFGSEYLQLTVDSEELASQVRSYLEDVSPEFVDKVSVHTGQDNIFDAYEITNQIRRALERKVWLKSGGYLIVEKTEAMWVIDVNTGKYVGERNLEETVLRNNIEAATEIARQLRLRDMGGIIVIDFVDMLVPANRDEVLKRFRRELARDKTKSRVMEISKLGLVQMTRKNVSQGLQESFTTRCDVCEGRGARIVESIV